MRKKVISFWCPYCREVHTVVVPVKEGKEAPKEPKETPDADEVTQVETYIRMIQEKLDFDNFKVTVGYLKMLHKVDKGAFMDLVMKQIALKLDTYYPDHISNAEELYIYSKLNSSILRLDPKITVKKKAFSYFSAFRSKREAVFAVKMAYEIKNFVVSYGNRE